MSWPEAFAIVGGGFALAAIFTTLGDNWPDIHIHKHYDKKK